MMSGLVLVGRRGRNTGVEAITEASIAEFSGRDVSEHDGMVNGDSFRRGGARPDVATLMRCWHR